MDHHPSAIGESQEPGPWVIRVPAPFLDDRMTDRERTLLLRLESMARTNPFCYPGNELLAQTAGKSTRAIQEAFESLEGLGWIRRVYADRHKRRRLGVVMLRRVDPRMPCARNPAEAARVEGLIRERRNLHSGGAGDGSRVKISRNEQGRRNESSITRTREHDSPARSTSSLGDSASGVDFVATADGIACNRAEDEPARRPVVDRNSLGGGAGGPDFDGIDEDTAGMLQELFRDLRLTPDMPSSVRGRTDVLRRQAALAVDALFDDRWKRFHVGLLKRVYRREVPADVYIERLLHVCRGVAAGRIENGGAYLYTMYQDRDRAMDDEWAIQHGLAVA